MSCQRCIRELLTHVRHSQWARPIRVGGFNLRSPYKRQPAFEYTTTSYRQPVTQSSSTDHLPSFISQTSNLITETITVQAESLDITEAVPTVPLVSLPPYRPYTSRTKFFQYFDQRTSTPGQRVLLTYTKSLVQANALVSQIKGPVIGFDLEWRPLGKVNVSLVQICDENRILLIHICNMKGLYP
jgi:hypothetical protein